MSSLVLLPAALWWWAKIIIIVIIIAAASTWCAAVGDGEVGLEVTMTRLNAPERRVVDT